MISGSDWLYANLLLATDLLILPRRRGLILLTVCLGAFMATLDTSIVNIALPQIARDFHCTLSQISWVMVIYLLVNVSLLLTSGRLGDLLAPGRLYLLGLLIFTGASALCGLSPGLPDWWPPGPSRGWGPP